MENTNIITEPPIQPIQVPITSEPKKQNIFKTLFIICFFVLIIVTISFIFILNSKNTIQPTIEPKTNNITDSNPTIVPTEVINEISYKGESIDYSQNKEIRLILKDNRNNETLIDQAKYWQLPSGETVKPIFNNIEISSANKYLYYFLSSGYEGGTSFLYNIKTKEKLNLGIAAEYHGYDQFEKYFYSCSGPGLGEGGASVYNLSTMKLSYKAPGLCYKCQLNLNNNIEIIEHESCVPKNPKKIEFSTETGAIK